MTVDKVTAEDLEGLDEAPVKWMVPGAGMLQRGSFVVLVDKAEHPWACTAYSGLPEGREAHLDTCFETWMKGYLLEAPTLEEAHKARAERRFNGEAYHLNDCELLDDRPTSDWG